MENPPISDTDSHASLLPLALNIPVEVYENMIDMVHSEHTRDTFLSIVTLHSCALVCRAWRVRAQKMLFYKIQLSDGTSLHKLATILDTRRHLRDYVHEIILAEAYLHGTTSIFALFPAVFSGKLPNLREIDVLHLTDTSVVSYPRRPRPSKIKALPYIPLHSRFPALLSSFTTVSILLLDHTVFRSLTEFERVLHGLPGLEDLGCNAVSWMSPGGSHLSPTFPEQPNWITKTCILPRFAPNLRMLHLLDMAKHGSERLIRMRGPYLTSLGLSIPLSFTVEEPENDATPVTELLASWKPRHSKPVLRVGVRHAFSFTRQSFVDTLCDLKTIMEAALARQKVEDPPLTPNGAATQPSTAPYALYVTIWDWEAKKKWWGDVLVSCFEPKFTQKEFGKPQVPGYFYTPPNENYEWAEEEAHSIPDLDDNESRSPSVSKQDVLLQHESQSV